VTLVAEQVAQLDSKDMDFATWQQLAQRCAHWLAQDDVAGIVVTHGTDTLEETAFFLQALLAPTKPVVLTGAMRPATARRPMDRRTFRCDQRGGRAGSARGDASCSPERSMARTTSQKAHTYRLDAFASGDAGPVGYVEEGRGAAGSRLARGRASAVSKIFDAAAGNWPRVEIVMSHAGASGQRWSSAGASKGGIRAWPGRAGTGNGTLHHALEEAALKAQAAGIAVVAATRCVNGRILPKAGDQLPAQAR
jgi:L-asparaginase